MKRVLKVCLGLLLAFALKEAAAEGVLKVCADPSNLPLSNDKGEGYENKIAAALAHDLNRTVEYTYFPQRMGFIRNTLRAKDEQTQAYKCDLVVGVPAGYELTATTRPYLHSVYALIVGPRADLKTLQHADDLLNLSPGTKSQLKIGVFSRSPGNDWLLKNALIERAVVYADQSGDAKETPATALERDLASGRIDVGILWGPIAAMLAMNHAGDKWHTAAFTPNHDIRFDYEIAMGMRQGESDWKTTVDGWIAGHGDAIAAILKSYQIPVVDAAGQVH
jgi:quinoprotein dehydrogenase-associated probable ABC transporter substrate-binding protein